MAQLFTPPFQQTLDANANAVSGARLFFYVSGTTTPTSVYADAALTTPLDAPVIADGAGRFVPIYLDPQIRYRVIVADASGTPIRDVDPIGSSDLADLADGGGLALVGYVQAGDGVTPTTALEKARDLVSRADFGIVGDGVTDDTAAITAAMVKALALGRALHLPGRYAVSNLRFPGAPDGDASSYVTITGEPTFVQAVANVPVLAIQNNVLQQSTGHVFSCTLVPHPNSDKDNAANIGADLTGFSRARVRIRLGKASSFSATKGRFHTMMYADAASPFFYGNDIEPIANAVPAAKYIVRLGNRGQGVIANGNINQFRPWCVALDTVPGDVLIDVGDSTQTIIAGPALLEGCPNAIGVKAGSLTTIRDVWFELVGVDMEFVATASTTPNNCTVERVYFSGGGHVVRIQADLGAPPVFSECVGDGAVSYIDQGGSLIPHKLWTRGYSQPAAPTVSFTVGSAPLSPQENSIRHRVDHHGRTTLHITYTSTPTATGPATLRIAPPAGWEIEQGEVGVRNSSDEPLAVALGDDLAGRDRKWVFANTTMHTINIRVTMRATA